MNISELSSELEKHKAKVGDIPVRFSDYSDGSSVAIDRVEVTYPWVVKDGRIMLGWEDLTQPPDCVMLM